MLLKCYLKGKISRKLANGQNIDYSEKRKWPKGFICPCTGVKYHNYVPPPKELGDILFLVWIPSASASASAA